MHQPSGGQIGQLESSFYSFIEEPYVWSGDEIEKKMGADSRTDVIFGDIGTVSATAPSPHRFLRERFLK